MLHSALIDFACISFRIPWVKVLFSRVKLRVVVGYSPTEEDAEERESFRNDLDRVVDIVEYRCVIGNLNGWVGDRVRDGITDGFGVPGENCNRRRGINFYDERGYVWVTHTSVTRVCICTLGAKTDR